MHLAAVAVAVAVDMEITAQALVVMMQALVLVMAGQEDIMGVGEVIVAIVVIIPMEGR